MRPVWLLGMNFLREQRLIVMLMSGWLLLFAVLFSLGSERPSPADLEVLYRQELAYGIIIGLFSGASLVYNERKSRRILAVLAKGLRRAHYLAGAWLGLAMLSGIYYLLVAVTNTWLINRFQMGGEAVTGAVLGWIAAQTAITVALALGSVLHPLLATAGAALVSAAGLVLRGVASMFPISEFLRATASASYAHSPNVPSVPAFLIAAILEAAIAFTIAVMVFNRKDVAVAVE